MRERTLGVGLSLLAMLMVGCSSKPAAQGHGQGRAGMAASERSSLMAVERGGPEEAATEVPTAQGSEAAGLRAMRVRPEEPLRVHSEEVPARLVFCGLYKRTLKKTDMMERPPGPWSKPVVEGWCAVMHTGCIDDTLEKNESGLQEWPYSPGNARKQARRGDDDKHGGGHGPDKRYRMSADNWWETIIRFIEDSTDGTSWIYISGTAPAVGSDEDDTLVAGSEGTSFVCARYRRHANDDTMTYFVIPICTHPSHPVKLRTRDGRKWQLEAGKYASMQFQLKGWPKKKWELQGDVKILNFPLPNLIDQNLDNTPPADHGNEELQIWRFKLARAIVRRVMIDRNLYLMP